MTNPNIPAIIGLTIQLSKILVKELMSVGEPVKIFHPIIAPTTACEVDTGKLARVIQVIEIATAKATVKLPAIALIPPRLVRVFVVPAPLINEPSTTNIPPIIAAVLNFIILDVTAVPKSETALLAPNDQPRNKPLLMKNQTEISNVIRTF